MKMKKVTVSLLALLLGFSLISCGGKKQNDPTKEETKEPTVEETEENKTHEETPNVDLSFDYYAKSKLRSDKKIYLLNGSEGSEKLSNDELFTAQAIQGLFARDEVTFYLNSNYVTNGINTDEYYLNEAKEEYGLEVINVTLKEAVEMYMDNWESKVKSGSWGTEIPLEEFNTVKGRDAYVEETKEGLKTPGFIVYRKGDTSVNVAATLCAITGFLPVELNDVSKYEGFGLTKKFDVDSIALGYNWLFKVALSEINPDGLVHQNYVSEGGLTNPFLKDYGIQNKYMYVYYDSLTTAPMKFRNNLHNFLTPNRPIFGYTVSEDNDVAFFSQFGQFIVPTDYTCNLSFFSAKELDSRDAFKQPNDDSKMKALPDKHYVAFVISDGDNATYWQNTQTFSTNYMNAIGRENDDFAVTWSITPSLADLMPQVMHNAYNYQATKHDYFCAPVSGQGYINAGNFKAQNNGENFKDYCEKLDIYMQKADLHTVTVIGGNSQGDLTNVLKGYASCDSVKGGIVYEGNKYFGNMRGGVEWVNGKPFVGPRDSLWETTPAYIAARLNMYECDPTSVNGYSIINVHPWSHSYEDIRSIVSMLNDNVEVVSVDAIINMMTENITDKSNTDSFKIPEKNGMSITEGQLQENPSLIPVNPLFNDFLLWEEDWSGTGLSYKNSDAAMSNVGAIYKGSIHIDNNSIATKREFTLPKIDNLWFSMSARADSQNPSDEASFKLNMTVDGVTKTVIEKATMRGVSGTGTEKVHGDGWQKFAFPLSQYFPNYQDKKCVVSIEVLDGKGIKVDQVEFKNRGLKEAFAGDPYNNEFDNGSTEDWFLGDQYKTSQYAFWGAYDHETLKPSGSIQIDCSDGGGNEKRNGNTNLWFAKTYTLPESNDIYFHFELNGGGIDGAMAKVSIYVDGHMLVLHDWTRQVGPNSYDVSLKELAPELNLGGKVATVVIEGRDCGLNNGVGESWNLANFLTTTK